MRKRFLFIIRILILIVGGIIGIWCFSSNDRKSSQNENNNSSNSIPENLDNFIQNDTNTVPIEESNVSNEIISGKEEESETTKNEEINNTKSEVNKTTQENKQNTNTKVSTQSKSNSLSNNSVKTQIKESVEKTTSTSTTTTPASNNSKKDTTQSNKVERCTNKNNHGMDVGNCGKWFNTKNEAIAYYEEKIKYWGNLWETYQIEDDEYYKNCPTGYEIWSCMYCSKWTINLYYR